MRRRTTNNKTSNLKRTRDLTHRLLTIKIKIILITTNNLLIARLRDALRENRNIRTIFNRRNKNNRLTKNSRTSFGFFRLDPLPSWSSQKFPPQYGDRQ